MNFDADIAISGGGAVGMLAAALAARAGFKVIIIEAAPSLAASSNSQRDLRTYALTRASERILRCIGIWPALLETRVTPFSSMVVWHAAGAGRVLYDAADIAEPALGYIVEHNALAACLGNLLVQLPGVHWCRPDTVRSVRVDGAAVSVGCAGGPVLNVHLLIGADGARSHLRSLLGARVVGANYAQSALIANVVTELPHGARARQRFLATGPVALLPLDEPCLNAVVWSTAPDAAVDLQNCGPQQFCEALTEASDGCLGTVTSCTQRLVFPLSRQRLRHYVQSGVAFVGDAAHVIHPLAGQGLNLGIMDAASLVEVLSDAAAANRDIGLWAVLRRYERWRKGENLAMELATDGLQRLFASKTPALVALRDFGFKMTNAAGPLKLAIMRRAMGLSGDLPTTARAPGL